MIPGFQKIIEARIRTAQENGEFDNLPGTGKPLAMEDDRGVPEDLRLAFKILKNADCLPPEIELKREIHRTEELLSGMTETSKRYRLLKKLNFLILKLNSTRKTNIVFDIPQRYETTLVNRLGSTDKAIENAADQTPPRFEHVHGQYP